MFCHLLPRALKPPQHILSSLISPPAPRPPLPRGEGPSGVSWQPWYMQSASRIGSPFEVSIALPPPLPTLGSSELARVGVRPRYAGGVVAWGRRASRPGCVGGARRRGERQKCNFEHLPHIGDESEAHFVAHFFWQLIDILLVLEWQYD